MSDPTKDVLTDHLRNLNAERRVAVRYASPQHSAGQPVRDEEGKCWSAHVVNLSAGGIGLLVNQRLDRAVWLTIDLPCKDEKGTRRLAARVQSVEQQAPGVWRVGCTFSQALSPGELLALL